MTFKHFSRLLFAGAALSGLTLGAGLDAVARPLAADGSLPASAAPDRRVAAAGPVLAQAGEEPMRRRNRDESGGRPGDRPERREDRGQDGQRQQMQQFQRQQERRQDQQIQMERPQRPEQQQFRQQRERPQDQERQQLERRQDQEREQRERVLDRQRQQQLQQRQQEQRLLDQRRPEQRERQFREQERLLGRELIPEGQQIRERDLRELRERDRLQRERPVDQDRRPQEPRPNQRFQEQERQQRERQLDRERQQQQLERREQELRQQERAQEQRRQERVQEQLRQDRLQEQRRQGFQEPPRERRGGFGLGVGDRRDMRVDELRALRRERFEQGGRRAIIEEQDRTIVREGNRYFIRHDETDRFRRAYGDAQIRRERRGQDDVTIVRRPNGVEVITIRDPNGNVLRRIRRDPGGRQIVLFENGGPRQGGFFEEVVALPPPRIAIPRERYIVEVESASQEDLYEAFTAPPVERIERTYTLDQVRQSPALRERVRRVDVDTVTFDFGSWELSEEQARALTGVGEALRRAIERNPSEVFLIEGHTDAVGNEVDNLTLSDRRAETVATVLTEMFGVPAENLTTQGYGEQYLKIGTEAPERQNRRVTIRRITPLLRNEARQ